MDINALIIICISILFIVFWITKKTNNNIRVIEEDEDTLEQKNNLNKEYSIYMTDEFTQEDLALLRPIATVRKREDNGEGEMILCGVLDGDGELTLDEAELEMYDNIQELKGNNDFISFIIHNDLNDEENEVAKRLEESTY